MATLAIIVLSVYGMPHLTRIAKPKDKSFSGFVSNILTAGIYYSFIYILSVN